MAVETGKKDEGKREDGKRVDAYDRRRREILDAALVIFGKKGFDGLTLEAVADAMGYTKPALYYYFRNKEEILTSLVIDSLREARDRMLWITEELKSPRERVRDLISYYMDQNFSRRGYFSMHHHIKGFLERALGEADREEIARLSQEIPHLVISMIAEGVDSGEFRKEDPAMLGSVIFGMLSGVLMHLDMPALAVMDGDCLKNTVCDIIVKGIEP